MSNTAQLQIPEAPTALRVVDTSPSSFLMDTDRFEQCCRIANLMATASLIPDHLRMDMKTKQPLPIEQVRGNCFMIVNQAFRWGFDPFAVAPETYVVGGKLAYQGKLVAAAVNALGGLVRDLDYNFTGQPGTDGFTIIVSGQKSGEDKPRTISVSVGQAKTGNEMWRKDPEQKLVYTGVVKWARRHAPGVIMGILIPEDLEDPADMRQASGREIPTGPALPKANPYTDDKPNSAEAPPATGLPSRDELIAAVKAGIKAAGRKNIEAVEIFKAAGLLKGKQMSDATDAELDKMAKSLDLLKKPEEPAAPAEEAAPWSEPEAKKSLLDRIEEAALDLDPPLKLTQLEAACRRIGVLSATGTLGSTSPERLEGILANLADIVAKAEAAGKEGA